MKRQLTYLWQSCLLSMCVAVAHADNCVVIKSDAQMERSVTDANGQVRKELGPIGKVLPGSEVVYTLTASNSCNKPTANVVINDPLPEHVTYVSDSASGVGATITYSIDGKTFAAWDALKTANRDGTSRSVRAEDIKVIRWSYAAPLNAGQSVFARFRARVN